ncbi:MAG TPA: hypothetical protein VNI84_13805 [Pyrinomonadaceae bacterium]|nr:hypothetical protein [Pyrinomonadaceae bacterium]
MLKALIDPESLETRHASRAADNLDAYRLALAYYERRMFAPGDNWLAYLAARGLYQHTRLIFNPVPNVVDFYVDNIWSAANDKDNPALVTPVSFAANENTIAAVAQLDQWSNWWREQQRVKAFAAATGGVLIEIIDDPERGKITQNTVWRGFVTDLRLNAGGDVEAYKIEYDGYDETLKETYKFRKTVDKEAFRYYKNDNPFDYTGAGAVYDNPYGFCPAVWVGHSAVGAAAFVDFNKVNHANSLASHLHDNIHKEIESGKLLNLTDPASLRVISGGTQNADGTINITDSRLDRVLIAAAGQGSVHDLSGLLKLAEAEPYLKNLLISFGDDYPELEYRQIIKENAQMSGIALERLLTPAQNRLDRAAPNYDGQLIKLRQMQIAIAGWRTKNGWTNLTKQQKAFAPFNLDSYERGDLDFNLKRSVLIEPTLDEIEDLRGKKYDNANKMSEMYSLKTRLIASGLSADEADEEIEQRAKEDPLVSAAYGMTDEANPLETGAGELNV